MELEEKHCLYSLSKRYKKKVKTPAKCDLLTERIKQNVRIMEEIITNAGFNIINQCSCGGTITQTWVKRIGEKKYVVKLRPNRKTFEIRLSNTRIATGKQEELTDKLKENGII